MGAAIAAFNLASLVISKLPGWIDAGVEVYDLYEQTQAVIDANKGPTETQWNELDAKAAALKARVFDKSKDV